MERSIEIKNKVTGEMVEITAPDSKCEILNEAYNRGIDFQKSRVR